MEADICAICCSEIKQRGHCVVCSTCLSAYFHDQIKKYQNSDNIVKIQDIDKPNLFDLRCPCCRVAFTTFELEGLISHDTEDLLSEIFSRSLVGGCDEQCFEDFCIYCTVADDYEAKSSQFLSMLKDVHFATSLDLKKFLRNCKRFARNEIQPLEMIQNFVSLCGGDVNVARNYVFSQIDEIGASFPALISNSILRAKFIFSFLNLNSLVPCSHCQSLVCFKCWKSAENSNNDDDGIVANHANCEVTYQSIRSCPSCGVSVLRDGGGPDIECLLCHTSFNWHSVGSA